MSVEPAINWQFHKAPGLIDPRARFTRTGAARSVGRTGLLRAVPANTGRKRWISPARSPGKARMAATITLP